MSRCDRPLRKVDAREAHEIVREGRIAGQFRAVTHLKSTRDQRPARQQGLVETRTFRHVRHVPILQAHEKQF